MKELEQEASHNLFLFTQSKSFEIGVSAFLGAIVSLIVASWLTQPQLEIEIVGGVNNADKYYYPTAIVRNKKRFWGIIKNQPAIDVVAYIDTKARGKSQQTDGSWLPAKEMMTHFDLQWSKERTDLTETKVTIYPGQERVVRLLVHRKNDSGYYPYQTSVLEYLEEGGDYGYDENERDFVLYVTDAEGHSVSKKFRANFKKNWINLRVEQL